ncbi:MAG: PfkB family carbohydrate kinase [Bacillota bacterium]
MGHIAVVGSANLDISIRSDQEVRFKDSNPGTITMHPGGVGRNIAENLARLQEDVHLFTLLGDEPNATYLKTLSEAAGVTVHDLGGKEAKGNRYAAFFDKQEDMMLGVADTKGIETLSAQMFGEKERTFIKNADMLVLETNLSPALIAHLVTLNDRVVMDCVSTAKAERVMGVLQNLHTLSMNRMEARALMKSEAAPSIEMIGDFFAQRGVKDVLITDGEKGAWAYRDGTSTHHPPFKVAIKSASGAGDAFVAGYAHGLKVHPDPLKPAMAAASIALESQEAVSKALTPDTLKKRMEAPTHEKPDETAS